MKPGRWMSLFVCINKFLWLTKYFTETPTIPMPFSKTTKKKRLLLGWWRFCTQISFLLRSRLPKSFHLFFFFSMTEEKKKHFEFRCQSYVLMRYNWNKLIALKQWIPYTGEGLWPFSPIIENTTAVLPIIIFKPRAYVKEWILKFSKQFTFCGHRICH